MGEESLIERGFDELPAEIALLDTHGDIIYTNRAWRMFAEANEYVGEVDSVGVNYLEVCDAARDESETAGIVADGLRSLIRGEQDLFSVEYPCHSPTVYRWFMMRAVPYDTPRHGRFVLVMHVDITERRLAELQVNEKNHHLTMLAHAISTELDEPLSSAIEAAGKLVAHDGPDAEALSGMLTRIEAIVERNVTLADQTHTLELDAVDFRNRAETAWSEVGTDTEISFRLVGGGKLAADDRLLGLFLTSLLKNRLQRTSVSPSPTQLVVGTTVDGFYLDDDGPRPSTEERAATSEEDQLLGVDYESVELSVARRIADLHGWELTLSTSELGGTRLEVTGVTWK